MCFLSASCLRQEAPEVDAEVMAESSDRVAPEEEVGGKTWWMRYVFNLYIEESLPELAIAQVTSPDTVSVEEVTLALLWSDF